MAVRAQAPSGNTWRRACQRQCAQRGLRAGSRPLAAGAKPGEASQGKYPRSRENAAGRGVSRVHPWLPNGRCQPILPEKEPENGPGVPVGDQTLPATQQSALRGERGRTTQLRGRSPSAASPSNPDPSPGSGPSWRARRWRSIPGALGLGTLAPPAPGSPSAPCPGRQEVSRGPERRQGCSQGVSSTPGRDPEGRAPPLREEASLGSTGSSTPHIRVPGAGRRDILVSATKWRKHFSEPYPLQPLTCPTFKKKKSSVCAEGRGMGRGGEVIFFHNKEKSTGCSPKLQIYFCKQ